MTFYGGQQVLVAERVEVAAVYRPYICEPTGKGYKKCGGRLLRVLMSFSPIPRLGLGTLWFFTSKGVKYR